MFMAILKGMKNIKICNYNDDLDNVKIKNDSAFTWGNDTRTVAKVNPLGDTYATST